MENKNLIDKAINFIQKNPKDNLSLQTSCCNNILQQEVLFVTVYFSGGSSERKYGRFFRKKLRKNL